MTEKVVSRVSWISLLTLAELWSGCGDVCSVNWISTSVCWSSPGGSQFWGYVTHEEGWKGDLHNVQSHMWCRSIIHNFTLKVGSQRFGVLIHAQRRGLGQTPTRRLREDKHAPTTKKASPSPLIEYGSFWGNAANAPSFRTVGWQQLWSSGSLSPYYCEKNITSLNSVSTRRVRWAATPPHIVGFTCGEESN